MYSNMTTAYKITTHIIDHTHVNSMKSNIGIDPMNTNLNNNVDIHKGFLASQHF